jgi:anti-sigma factor ChrR (cupin superfamily)
MMAEELEQTIADYVLGVVRGPERAAIEAHFENDPALRTKIERLERSFVMLDLRAGQQQPDLDLYDNILKAIDTAETGQESGQEAGTPGKATRRTGASTWEQMAPGVTFQILYDDLLSKRRSLLMRIEPGAIYRAHGHANGHEELLILEGDLIFEDCRLSAGDFHVAAIDTTHSDARSIGGCLAHISTAL